MSVSESIDAIVHELHRAGIEFIIVGATAAVMVGTPILTQDVDIVPRRTPENADKLYAWLLQHGAYHRLDLANRRLPPARDVLLGHGHVNLQVDLGMLDILCELEPGQGYEELIGDTVLVDIGENQLVRVLSLSRLIAAKARAGRAKDRAVLPVLMATLDEQKRRGSPG